MKQSDIDRIMDWIANEGLKGRTILQLLDDMGFTNRQIAPFIVGVLETDSTFFGTDKEVIESINILLDLFAFEREERSSLKTKRGESKESRVTELSRKHLSFPKDETIVKLKDFQEKTPKIKGRRAHLTIRAKTIISTERGLGKSNNEIAIILARNDISNPKSKNFIDPSIRGFEKKFEKKVDVKRRTFLDVVKTFDKEQRRRRP